MVDEAPPQSESHEHKVLRYVLFAFGALVLLLLLAVILVQTSWARRAVLARATAWLATQGIAVTADSLDYRLVPLSVSARNLRLVIPTDSAEVTATVGDIALDIDAASLLRQRYVLTSGTAKDVTLHYVLTGPGSPLARPQDDRNQTGNAGIPTNVLVDAFEATNVQVQYDDRPHDVKVQLPIEHLSIDGDRLTGRHALSLTAAGGSFVQQASSRQVAIDRLAARASVNGARVTVETQMDAVGSRLSASGIVEGFSDPRLDLKLNGQFDVARLAAVLNVPDVGGTAQLDAKVEGTLGHIVVTARTDGRGLSYRTLSNAALEARAVYDADAQSVAINALTLNAPWAHLNARGTVALDDAGHSEMTAEAQGLDAAVLADVFAAPARVASRVDANVSAAWPGINVRAAAGTATARLTAVQERTGRALPLGGRVRIDATQKMATADILELRVPGAGARGVLRLADQERLDGDITLETSDIPLVARTTERVLGRPAGSLLAVPVAGRVRTSAHVGGTVTSPTLAADMTAPDLQVSVVSGIDASARLDYRNEHVLLQGVDVVWAEARAHAQGTVTLGDSTSLDLTFNADRVPLASIAQVLEHSELPLSGDASLVGQVTGAVDRPLATVALTATDLTLYQEPLGVLTLDASLADQRVTVDTLRLDKPQADGTATLSGNGSYSLADRSYTLVLESDSLRLEHAALPGGTPMRGRLDVRANGSGTTDSPSGIASVRLADAQWGPRELGDISVNADVSGGEAAITAVNDRFNLEARARVGVLAPYPATMDADIDGLDVSTLPLQVEIPLAGTLRASMKGSGALANISASNATVTIDGFEGSINNQPIRIAAPAVARYSDQRVHIDAMHVEASGTTVSLSGDLPLNENAEPGTVAVDARMDLWSLPMYVPAMNELSTYGVATVTGQIAGTLKALEPDLNLRIENGMVQGWTMSAAIHDISMSGRVAEGFATIDDLSATFADEGRLTASGRVPLNMMGAPVALPPSADLAVELHADSIDPRMFPGSPEALHGTLALDVSLAGPRPSLSSLRGSIVMPTIDVAVDDLDFTAAQPVRIAIADGRAQIEQFSLAGSVGHLDVTGFSELDAGTLNLGVEGEMNLAVINTFAPSLRSEGTLALAFEARGSVSKPDLRGTVEIADATVGIDEPQIAGEHLAVRLTLEGPRATLTQFSGQLNGGDLSGAGAIVLGGDVPLIDLQLSATDVALSTPLDMRSVSDTHVRVHTDANLIAVDGNIGIKEAGLTGDINFDTGLLAAINARRTLDLTEQRNPLLERVRFNVNVDTTQPIVIDNNLARAEVSSDLRVLGTPYEVGLSGRLTLGKGSVVTLTEHEYEVERGAITFLGERRIQPSFDLQLTTTASNYNITLMVSGQPGQTDTTLTSIPSLPEPDIMALLVTGRTLDDMRGEEFAVAREQVMSYLAGRLGSQLGQGIERVTGLSDVRIEPNLIANEVDPGARLTIGQDLGDNLKLVYSTNLADSSDEVWVLTYDLTRRFRTRAVRQSDGSYRADFRHDVRFGGTPEPRRQKRQRPPILAIAFSGDSPLGGSQLEHLLGVHSGHAFDFLELRDGIDRINRELLDEGYLQSRISSGREVTAEGVRLTVGVTAGPRVEMAFEGWTPSTKLQRALREQWQRGVVDRQRVDDGIETIREWLLDERYMNPSIQGHVEESGTGQRRVLFDVARGSRYSAMDIVFDGAERVPAVDLVRIVHDQDQELKLYTDPAVVVALLERYYHEQGFLTADVHTPRYEYEGSRARVILDVNEGPRYTTRRITIVGNTVYASDRLIGDMPLLADDIYRPAVAERSLDRVRELYWQRGYNDVVSDYVLTLDRSAGLVDVAFSIDEGSQVVVSDILVTGNEQTKDALVRGQLQVSAGEPLDLAALARSRKNLYDTGAYSLVEVEQKNATTPAPAGISPPLHQPPPKPIDLAVTVREVQPYQLEYGASYDTERGIGGILDLSDHNTLGAAREIGVRSRYDAQLHEVRLYFTQPSLRTWPLKTAINAYTSRERDPATSLASAFTIDRTGISGTQERELRNHYIWTYGFRYERAHTFDATRARDELVNVAPLTSTFSRDTRDDLLDATRGSFTSHAFSYSPSWLGADAPFVKYFGQYFHYFPLQAVRRKPLTNELLRPRVVYAAAVRFGIARGLGNEMPTSERFFAGGSTTMRGFEQNAVGPLTVGSTAAGGAASLVINNEIRFPLVSSFDGVAFADTGNVFAGASNFSLANLRQTIGVGLRVRTRWFLVRGDYGFVLAPRSGEPRSRAYFSIGQAF